MAVLKFLFDFFKDARNKELFDLPAERESEGSVSIRGNKIVRKSRYQEDNVKIKIKSIAFVYVTSDEDSPCVHLYILEKWPYLISIDTIGFAEMYSKLSKKLGFDDSVFKDVIQQKKQQKQQLFRRIKKKNFSFTDGSYNDYSQGFEVLGDKESIFVNWNSTKDELEKNRYAYTVLSDYGREVLWFSHPVRIGNIIVEDFEATIEPLREGMPASLNFYVNCYDDSNTSVSYSEIKAQLQTDFAQEDQRINYERDDQNSCTFTTDGIEISLGYDFDSKNGYDRGCTFFCVNNNRDFSETVIGKEGEAEIKVYDYLLFDKSVVANINYQKDNRVIKRPFDFYPKFAKRSLMWVDLENNKIGFAGVKFCMVFSIDEISHFSFQNILPAKGGGRAYLRVHLAKKEEYRTILTGKCHDFDDFSEKLPETIKLLVLKEMDEMDC